MMLIALSSLCALAPIAYDWNGAVSSDFIPTIVIAVVVWIAAAALIALKRTSANNAELKARPPRFVKRDYAQAGSGAPAQGAGEGKDLVGVVRVGTKGGDVEVAPGAEHQTLGPMKMLRAVARA